MYHLTLWNIKIVWYKCITLICKGSKILYVKRSKFLALFSLKQRDNSKFSLIMKVVLKNHFYFLLNVSHNINKTLMNIFVENLRSTDFGANEWPILSILIIIRILLKNIEVTLAHNLMPVIGYNIRKNLKNWQKKVVKCWFWV